ncbi:MAG: hypothetical protein H7327_05655 [Herminiimonas sp.]|nr:hypothetical protein [Herminiimonas sp.]
MPSTLISGNAGRPQALHAACSTNDARSEPAAAAGPNPDGSGSTSAAGHLNFPASLKQQRKEVKKIVADLEKLQRRGNSFDQGSPAQGAAQASNYVQELSARHARLCQYMEAGLSAGPPPFSLSRSAKNKLAIAGGGLSVAASAGALATFAVATTSAAVVCIPLGAVVGAVAGSVSRGIDSFDDCFYEKWLIEEALKGAVDGMRAGAALPAWGLLVTFDTNERNTHLLWWRNATVGRIRNINQLDEARRYAARLRLSTQEIALDCRARMEEDLQRNQPTAASRPVAASVVGGFYALPKVDGLNWRFPETEQNAAAFNIFKERVAGTKEYASLLARPALLQRIDALVNAMRCSPSLRGTCFTIAADAINSCSDRISLALNDMDAALISEKAETGQLSMQELRLAGIAKFEMKTLDDIAMAKIAALRRQNLTVDEVEMRLVYPTELADRLDLPGVVRSMEYRRSAGVSDVEISMAANDVRDRLGRGEGTDFLAAWTPWRDALERTYPSDYAAVRETISAARDRLALPPDHMTSQQWLTALERQKLDEERQLSDLAKRLSTRFVSSH